MQRTIAILLLGMLVLGPVAAADEVTIAAAADLSFAFKEMTANFEKNTGHKVKLTIGSSGNFYSQIQNGAPFDLFFSADMNYPQKLAEANLAEPGSLYRYATGHIVIWARNDVSLDLQKLGINALTDSNVRKISIANPRVAPYGRAAVAAMQKLGVYEKVTGKLVFGENVSQTAQFVESGNADVGIIGLALASAPAMQAKGKFWEIPPASHPPIDQGVVIIKASQHKAAAQAFLDYVKSADGTALMKRYGFVVPTDSPAEAGKDGKKKKDEKKNSKS